MKTIGSIVFAGLLVASDPVSAEVDTYLTEPTRDCVFGLATEAAEAEYDPGYWIRSTLRILVHQERSGAPDHAETRAAFLAHFAEKWPDVARQGALLRFHSDVLIGPLMNEAPETAADFATYILDLMPEIEPKRQKHAKAAAGYFLMFAGDRAKVEALLEAATAEEQAVLEREVVNVLILQGRYSEALQLIETVGVPKERLFLKADGIDTLVKKKEYQNAQDLAGHLLDAENRALHLSNIALAMAMDGEVDGALELLEFMKQQNLDRYDSSTDDFALVHAVAGDTKQMELLIWSIENSHVFSSVTVDGIRAVHAASSGNNGEILLYLQDAEDRFDYERRLWTLGRAYLQSGYNDLSLLGLSIPAEYQREGLGVLGYLQVQQGDIEGALDTYEDLWRLNPNSNGRSVFDDRNFALERLMIAQGRVGEAVKLAYERKDSPALSFLATMIP
ncbi:hypothetical protein [Ruegeria arenilitoris]|uniref:hypothetical protein n=1 Tax=Ruegeria arenilitoris TaxID=1173585 RepID=UPI00147D4750|nr:hypothetical protein [Ruegeria arenilitoris]